MAHGLLVAPKACRNPAQPSIARYLCRDQGEHGKARETGHLDYRSCRNDDVFLADPWLDDLLARLELPCAAAPAIRPAYGICVLAVHLEHDPDPAHAVADDRPEHPGPSVRSARGA